MIEEQSKVKQNYKLMQLYTPSISAQTAHKINNLIDEDERHFNKTLIRAMMLEDGFGEINWSDLFQVCNKISMEHRRA